MLWVVAILMYCLRGNRRLYQAIAYSYLQQKVHFRAFDYCSPAFLPTNLRISYFSDEFPYMMLLFWQERKGSRSNKQPPIAYIGRISHKIKDIFLKFAAVNFII